MSARRRRAPDVAGRAEALTEALDAGGHRLDPDATRRARTLVGKVSERAGLSGDHTVVALAGATGSGKSSLFNELARIELSEVGARRPTTSAPVSVIWGPEGADGLLDWLQVPRRHRTSRQSALDRGDDGLDGLVLLDLPDHDSTALSHRLEVDRLVELVDVFVWVTDPQKYADSLLHQRYLSKLAGHDAVTIVVLNQVDRLGDAAAVESCRRDLARLVEADGLHGVQIITTSVRSQQGLDDLREALARAVQARTAWSERLAADLDASVAEVGSGVGEGEPEIGSVARDSGLVDALAAAAGVPAVLDAVESDYVRGATKAGGWPMTRWVSGLRPDPLARLRLGQRVGSSGSSGASGAAAAGTGSEGEGREATALLRSSLPEPTPAQRSRVELATRRVSDTAVDGLPRRWADAVRAAAVPPVDDLGDALDQAVVGTDLDLRRPGWWRVVAAVQAVLAAVVLLGAVWLILLAVSGWLRLPQVTTPYVGPIPVPTLMLVGGLLAGLLLGVLVGVVASTAARRRRTRVGARLFAAVERVAQERVLDPVAAVLAAHRSAREALARAGR